MAKSKYITNKFYDRMKAMVSKIKNTKKINFIKIIFMFIVLIIDNKLYSMQKSLSRLDINSFKNLKNYASLFLKANRNRIACEKNESGFIRINIPILENLKIKHPNIKKIRLNYWSPDSNTEIVPESIHNHPNYFESLIIDGGYNHEIYEIDSLSDNTKEYDLYTILKSNNVKSFIFNGNSSLKFIKNARVNKNDLITIDRALIHRVIKIDRGTLFLNVVFENDDNSNDIDYHNYNDKSIKDFYNVYLTKYSKFDKIKTKRDLIINLQAKKLIDKIIQMCDKQ